MMLCIFLLTVHMVFKKKLCMQYAYTIHQVNQRIPYFIVGMVLLKLERVRLRILKEQKVSYLRQKCTAELGLKI